MKITKSLQDRLEGIFKSIGFVVRYEKGNFQSGYCILEEQNVLVINKFFPMESKVNTLIEVLRTIEADKSHLNEGQMKLFEQIAQKELKF